MTTAGTWALVIAVVTLVVARHLLVAVTAGLLRTARARTTRVRAAAEGSVRRRTGAELHAIPHLRDWETSGWFGPEVPSIAGPSREAAARPVPTRRAA